MDRLNDIYLKADPFENSQPLEKFGSLLLIDSLVKIYPSYTHEDVFRFELKFAFTLLIINKSQAAVRTQGNELRRKSKKRLT